MRRAQMNNGRGGGVNPDGRFFLTDRELRRRYQQEAVIIVKRSATNLISEVSSAQEPMSITRDGLESEAVEPHMLLLEGLARGEKAILEGHTLGHEAARNRLSRWLD